MSFAFLTFCARRTVSIFAMSSIAILGAVLGQSDALAAERANPGWLVSVNGKSIVTPSFPGSEHFSFISFPASSVASPNLSDHLIGQDDSLSLVLFSPNPALSVGAIGRYDPNRSTFDAFAGPNKKWSVEPGVFAEYWASPDLLRIRGELRMGAAGVAGMTGDLGADFVQRIGKFVISAGPHVGMSGIDYTNARYGDAGTSYIPGETIGARSFGASGNVKFAAGRNWSTSFYANYDRVMTPGGESQKNSNANGFNDEVRVGASFNMNFTPPAQ
jgi:outer membrane scaffolding protein for murein synthesis (MipA/OmpV family)